MCKTCHVLLSPATQHDLTEDRNKASVLPDITANNKSIRRCGSEQLLLNKVLILAAVLSETLTNEKIEKRRNKLMLSWAKLKYCLSCKLS